MTGSRMARMRGDRGVAAITVAIAMVAIMGAGMLSVDAGGAWRARRSIVTYSDAAALASARFLSEYGSSACNAAVGGGTSSTTGSEARYILQQNDPSTTLTALTVAPNGGSCSTPSGHVRVDARLPYSTTFAGLFGFGNLTAFSSSTAEYGPLVTMGGLRPIALCDQEKDYVAWSNYLNGTGSWTSQPGDPYYGPGHIVKRIPFQKQKNNDCGQTDPGNWGWLDFNDGISPNGDSAVDLWLHDGYPGTVSLGDTATNVDMDCDPEIDGSQGCSSNTGAHGSSVDDSLAYLRDTGTIFPIVIFDRVINPNKTTCGKNGHWKSSGTNTQYCPVAFLLVRLWGWFDISGSDGWFNFEFINEDRSGQIGVNPAGGLGSVQGVQLCGGNYGTTIDTRCDV